MKRCIIGLLFLFGCGSTIDVSRDGSVPPIDSWSIDTSQIPVDSQIADSVIVQADAQVNIVNCFSTVEISGPRANVFTTFSCDGRDLDIELLTCAFATNDVLIVCIPQTVNCTSKAGVLLSERSFIARIEVTYTARQINESGTCKRQA